MAEKLNNLKVISTNTAKPSTILWNKKEITTGIYKTPTNSPIFLEKENVKGDEVSNRDVHGGEYKACYLFSKNQYPYWKNLYPNLNWSWGMFGENLTISDLDESKIYVGDIYKLGEALVQITQPREPCFKFGVKFGSQHALQQFIEHDYPGTYVRVLKEGFVKPDDAFTLVEKHKNSISISELFNLIYSKNKDKKLLEIAINNESLPLKKRKKLEAFIK